MDEYIDLFRREGYSKKADIENLKGLKETDLKDMGITKRGTYIYTYACVCTLL